MTLTRLLAAAALALVALPARAQKAVTPAPVKKPVVAPTAVPKAAMPVTITTARLSFTGMPAGGITIATARLSFVGAPPGGVVVSTSGLSFVGGGVKMSSIATPALTFVGAGGTAPRTIATDPISFVGRPPR